MCVRVCVATPHKDLFKLKEKMTDINVFFVTYCQAAKKLKYLVVAWFSQEVYISVYPYLDL